MSTLYDYYDYIANDLADPRLNNWLLVKSPITMCSILGIYLIFVKIIGPKYMMNREPFHLRNTLLVYNAVQILYNLYLAIMVTPHIFSQDWRCAQVDYSNNKSALEVASLAWLYYINKYIDLLDTIFFVLRKNNRQITFLHVYHHISIIIIGFIGVKYVAGGHSLYLGYINSIVHCVMYLYYFLTIYDASYKQHLWWKKYITQMQLVQFAALFVIYFRALIHENCNYPKFLLYTLTPQTAIFTYLFGSFYYKTYNKKKEVTKCN